MNKQDIIEHIRRLNPTAPLEFLAGFEEDDLLAYLHQLQEVECERQRQGANLEPALAG